MGYTLEDELEHEVAEEHTAVDPHKRARRRDSSRCRRSRRRSSGPRRASMRPSSGTTTIVVVVVPRKQGAVIPSPQIVVHASDILLRRIWNRTCPNSVHIRAPTLINVVPTTRFTPDRYDHCHGEHAEAKYYYDESDRLTSRILLPFNGCAWDSPASRRLIRGLRNRLHIEPRTCVSVSLSVQGHS